MTTIKTKLNFFKSLLCLKECIDVGQIQSAAVKNGLKQENLSKIITELERVAKINLLHRSSSGVTPTNTARLLYDDVTVISKRLDALSKLVLKNDDLSGYITIWSEEGFTGSYMLKMLSEFYAKYPQIRLDILASSDVNISLVDIAVVHDYTRQKMVGKTLFTTNIKTHFYSSESYLKKNGMPKDFDDLLENHALCMRQMYLSWPDCGCILRQAKHLNVTADLISIVVSLVKAGEGIGLLPDWCAQMNPDLIKLDNINFETHHEFKGICRLGLEDDPKILALTNFLKENLEIN